MAEPDSSASSPYHPLTSWEIQEHELMTHFLWYNLKDGEFDLI